MLDPLFAALKARKQRQEIGFSLVLDAQNAVPTHGVRHGLIFGGKVIDLIRKPETGGSAIAPGSIPPKRN